MSFAMTSVSIRFSWRLLAAWTLVLMSPFDNSVAAVTTQKYLRNARNLISSNCTNIRPPDAHYADKLDLFYGYTVEFESAVTTMSLAGLALAVSSVVVELLADQCDSMSYPMFKVKSDARHYVAQDEVCVPETMGNPCYVVNGVTTILLDKRSVHIQQRVYDAIALGLENSSLIQGFAPGLVRAEFQRPLGESLTPNPSSDREDSASAVPVAATIVVAAASVSIFLGSMFWYSIMCRDRRLHPDPNIRYKSRGYVARSLMVVHGLGLDPHRIHRRFSRLNDASQDSELANMDAFKNDSDGPAQIHHDATPSIIWSVSDITSDSGSVLSGTSVTGSRLERIDEEGDENIDESDESRERKCLSRQRAEHVLDIQHDRLVKDERSAIDAELVSLVPMDISSLDNDLEEELEGYRFIRDEIASECIEGCPSSTVNDYDVEFRVEMMDGDASIYSSLSSSDDDDDFHQANPEIQDES